MTIQWLSSSDPKVLALHGMDLLWFDPVQWIDETPRAKTDIIASEPNPFILNPCHVE
jgi:hypothetical protein